MAGEYVDNDLSAYTGKHRPEYERMLADLADGLVDAVLVYNIDRLTRRPAELEQFHEAVDRAGVRHVRFVTGDTDIVESRPVTCLTVIASPSLVHSRGAGR